MANLTLVVTPRGIRCPLACDYCYNSDPHLKQRIGSRNMSTEVLGILLGKFMRYPQNKYEIIWHGGEPALAGIPFYKEVVRIQQDLASTLELKAPVINHFQTNGILIDAEWADFFKSNGFKVGVSIDGPQDIHDSHRVYPNGKGSHEEAMRGVGFLKDSGTSLGAGTVVTRKTLENPVRDFEFMRENFKVFDFSPCFTAMASDGTWTQEITPHEYADFVKTVFDYWFELDDPNIKVRSFKHYIEAALGHIPRICSMANGCHRYLSVDGQGDVYPCGRLHGIPALCFGSIKDQTFEEIQLREDYLVYQEQAHHLDVDCETCKWRFACNNGCTASRYTETGEILPKTPFCEATKEILEHVSNKVKQVQS